MMETEIDIVALIDGTIRDCVAAKIPPYPTTIAETLAGVLCRGSSAESHAVMILELNALIRERIEFLSALGDVVN